MIGIRVKALDKLQVRIMCLGFKNLSNWEHYIEKRVETK